MHCNQASYEDVEVHGLDPLAAPSQQIWGYETTWGSFAQFCKVQAQQLLPKPKALDLGGGRLLRADVLHRLPDARRPGAPAGGPPRADLGRRRRPRRVRHPALHAVGRRLAAASSPRAEKGELVKSLGAVDYIDRNEFAGMMRRGDETPDEEKARFKESRRFGKAVAEKLGGEPDIVFEHVGRATFPTSVLVVKPFGTVVICGATSGYHARFRRPLPVDAPEADHRLALRQRLGMPPRERADRGRARSVPYSGGPWASTKSPKPISSCTRTSTSARSRSSWARNPRALERQRTARARSGRRWEPRWQPEWCRSPGTRPCSGATSSRRPCAEIAPDRHALRRHRLPRLPQPRRPVQVQPDGHLRVQARLRGLLVRPRVHRLAHGLLELVPGPDPLHLERPDPTRAVSSTRPSPPTATGRRRRPGAARTLSARRGASLPGSAARGRCAAGG